ncbi:MAG: peroxiredoxin-like family protein [Gammaproteobacteria bacterium]|nr:peroxiredoxin-like family protein [Gammaproteobacteria bacterium]
MSHSAHSLTDQLGETVDAFISSLPDDDAMAVGASFEKLQASSTGENAINVGAIAPDFTLPAATGAAVTLHDKLNAGPVILNFYRGGWCPFCNLELRALQAALPEIRALGASLIGVSPETPDNSMTTAEKHQLEFDVLSDIGNTTARDYGLIFTVYEEMRPLYLKWGLDVPASNGDNSWELPVPATYVIDSNSVVRAAHVDKDYTKRMEPEQILTALRNIKT